VEIGLLIDTVRRFGLDAIAQVDLGVRKHRNRNLLDLGVMSQQVLATVLARVGVDPHPRPVDLVQYVQQGGVWQARSRWVAIDDRPPLAPSAAASAPRNGGRGTIES
jgi:glucosyl-3-phosphoglycerate synthase